MAATAIEFTNVVKRFGTVTALDNVSLQISEGEFFSLLGPSGCGKTTSLRLIAGFESPTQGKIIIAGQRQDNLPPHKRPVNTVFQNYALFPHMNVFQNVAFGLEMDGIPSTHKRKRVNEILELVRLPGMEERRPNQLSGGQQQRVALARALVKKPKVLLLDEPLGALDLKLRKAMQVELKSLQTRLGITFVYVTHDQEEALTMSDRIAVMKDGVIQQIGFPQEIYENPVNRFVADFIGETNFIPGIVNHLSSELNTIIVNGYNLVAKHADHGLTPGQEAFLSIRPEKVQISVNGNLHSNTGQPVLSYIPGRILQAHYLGTDTRYVIDSTNGILIIARLQNLNGTETRFHPGDQVEISWDPGHARLLNG